ncbi:MAG: hypothetical protein LM582_02715 [Desulfurococcaceae archaeon]|nr:hypothetical protein [Desulfurococcaceae archaeon]
MVWITKREIAYYLILKQVFQNRIFNLGEALDILTLFGSKRTTRKIIKILVSRGLLERVDVYQYKVKDLESSLLLNLRAYLAQRIYKRLKSLGFDVSLGLEDDKEYIAVHGCNDALRSMINILNKFVDVKCVD